MLKAIGTFLIFVTVKTTLMSEHLKRISSIILLLVFLMPVSGMMLYVHECNMKNITYIDVESQKPCCNQEATNESSQHQTCCSLAHKLEGNYHTTISALPCCVDSKLFIKLNTEQLAQSIKVLHTDLPVFINNIANFPTLENDFSIVAIASYSQYYYPPGNDTYLKVSSLRL